MQNLVLTANGIYPINSEYVSSKSVILASGTPDGATASLISYSPKGTKYNIQDSAGNNATVSTGFQNPIEHGFNNILYVEITNAGASTSIEIEAYPTV